MYLLTLPESYLVHVILGGGFPVASQIIVRSSPAETSSVRSQWTIEGGTATGKLSNFPFYPFPPSILLDLSQSWLPAIGFTMQQTRQTIFVQCYKESLGQLLQSLSSV